MTITADTALANFEDTPSVAAVLRSPNFLVRETLAGLVTALALIPEVISFSFISGVDPKVALVASIVLGLVMSALGGRPAMVTAAAGSCTPFIEWTADHLPENRMGVLGVGLILIGFTLQSIQYWLALLDVSVR